MMRKNISDETAQVRASRSVAGNQGPSAFLESLENRLLLATTLVGGDIFQFTDLAGHAVTLGVRGPATSSIALTGYVNGQVQDMEGLRNGILVDNDGNGDVARMDLFRIDVINSDANTGIYAFTEQGPYDLWTYALSVTQTNGSTANTVLKDVPGRAYLGGRDSLQNILVSTDSIMVAEGSTSQVSIRLAATPAANVHVIISKLLGSDSDLAASQPALTFTPDNWNTPQILTITAGQDADQYNGTGVFRIYSPGLGIAEADGKTLNVLEGDDDIQNIVVTPLNVDINEGGSAQFSVRLSAPTLVPIQVQVTKDPGGDADITTTANILTFTFNNWSIPQIVTLNAAEDDTDTGNGTASFTMDSPGLSSVTVDVTEIDNDVMSVIYSPVTKVGNVEAGLFVGLNPLGQPQTLGNFWFGGTITGKVQTSGSLGDFYAGLILTGNTRGELGYRNAVTGRLINPTVPDNFKVGGDVYRLTTGSAIGMAPNTVEDTPSYRTGFDLNIAGKLGQLSVGTTGLTPTAVNPDSVAGHIRVGTGTAVSRLELIQTEAESVASAVGIPTDQLFSRFLLPTASGPSRNDHPMTAQIIGTDFAAIKSDNININGSLNRATLSQVSGIAVTNAGARYIGTVGISQNAGTSATTLALEPFLLQNHPGAGAVNYYRGCSIYITDGNGEGQLRVITASGVAYGTIVVTVDAPWDAQKTPEPGSRYLIGPQVVIGDSTGRRTKAFAIVDDIAGYATAEQAHQSRSSGVLIDRDFEYRGMITSVFIVDPGQYNYGGTPAVSFIDGQGNTLDLASGGWGATASAANPATATATTAASVQDLADYFGTGLLAGQTITAQLKTQDVVYIIPSGTVEVGDKFEIDLYDGDGRRIGSSSISISSWGDSVAAVCTQLVAAIQARLTAVNSSISVSLVGDLINATALGPPTAVKLVTANLGDRIQVTVRTKEGDNTPADLQKIETVRERIYLGVFDPDDRLVATDFENLEADWVDANETMATLPQATTRGIYGNAFSLTTDRPGLYRFAVGTPNIPAGLNPGQIRQPWDKVDSNTADTARPFSSIGNFGVSYGTSSFLYGFDYRAITRNAPTANTYSGSIVIRNPDGTAGFTAPLNPSELLLLAGPLSAQPAEVGISGRYALTGDVAVGSDSYIQYVTDDVTNELIRIDYNVTFKGPAILPADAAAFAVCGRQMQDSVRDYQLIVNGVGYTSIAGIESSGSLKSEVSVANGSIGYIRTMQDVATQGRIVDVNLPEGGSNYVGHIGNARGSTSTTMDLAQTADPAQDFYKNCAVWIVSGTGQGQVRAISGSAVNNGRVVITVNTPWDINPAVGSRYLIGPQVVIADPSGTGAVAAAEVDNLLTDPIPPVQTLGVVTSVHLINPGVNYSPGQTRITFIDGQGDTTPTGFGAAASAQSPARASAVVSSPQPGDWVWVSLDNGDLKTMVGWKGLQANITVNNGDIGLLRSGGDTSSLGPKNPADWATWEGWYDFYNTNPLNGQHTLVGAANDNDFVPDMVIKVKATTTDVRNGKGNIQMIDTARDLSADVVLDAGLGVMRVGRDLMTSRIHVGHDNRAQDGVIDLIDVGRDMYAPIISHGAGGNVRYVRVTGSVRDDHATVREFTRLADGESVVITDDSGAMFEIKPVSNVVTKNTLNAALDPDTGQWLSPAYLQYLPYEIYDGETGYSIGVVLISLDSSGSMAIRATDNNVGGSVEIGTAIIRAANGQAHHIASRDPVTGRPSLRDDAIPAADVTNNIYRQVGLYVSGTTPISLFDVTSLDAEANDPLHEITSIINTSGRNIGGVAYGGSVVNVSAASVGEIRVVGSLGIGFSEMRPATLASTPAINPARLALNPRYLMADRYEQYPFPPVPHEIEERGYQADAYPFYQQRIGVVTFGDRSTDGDLGDVYVGGSVGNILAGGRIGSVTANWNGSSNNGTSPVNLNDAVFRGIVAPIYAAGTIYAVNVGEGLMPNRNGEVAACGIFSDQSIEAVGAYPGADIRGDIIAREHIGLIQLYGGSIVNADIMAGVTRAMAAEYNRLDRGTVISTIIRGSGIGAIRLESQGGIIGSTIAGQYVGPVTVNGYGIANSFILAGPEISPYGVFDITVGGYGIRNTRIFTGVNEGKITATGTGQLVLPAAMGQNSSLGNRVAGQTASAFTDVGMAFAGGLYSIASPGTDGLFGTADDKRDPKTLSYMTGVIDGLDAKGLGSLGMVSGWLLTNSRFRYANVLGGFASASNRSIERLDIFGGALSSFALPVGFVESTLSIGGKIDSVLIRGDMRESVIQSIGQNASIGTVYVLGNMDGIAGSGGRGGSTIRSSGLISTVYVTGNMTGRLIAERGRADNYALNSLVVLGNLNLELFDTQTLNSATGYGDVRSIVVYGNIAGTAGANLNTGGVDPNFNIGKVDSIVCLGSMTDVNLRTRGNLGLLQVVGAIVNSTIDVQGYLGTLIAGRWTGATSTLAADTAGAIITYGDLGSDITLRNANAQGNSLNMLYVVGNYARAGGQAMTLTSAGSVNTVVVTGNMQAATLDINGSAGATGDSIGMLYVMGTAIDSVVDLAGGATALYAGAWIRASVDPLSPKGNITGQYVTSLVTTRGNFGGGLWLTGRNVSGNSMTLMSVAGAVNTTQNIRTFFNVGTIVAGSWNVTHFQAPFVSTVLVLGNFTGEFIVEDQSAAKSSLDYLYVAGQVANAQVRIRGKVGTVVCGSMLNSLVTSSIDFTATTMPTADQFLPLTVAQPAAIVNLMVLGDFRNSVIAAPSIFSAYIGRPATNNTGIPHGVAVNGSIRSMVCTPTGHPTYAWYNVTTDKGGMGDFVVDVVA